MPQPPEKRLSWKKEGEPESNFTRGKNHILAIGINKYQHCAQLNNAVGDAEAVIKILKEKYQFEEKNITTVFDEKASWDSIDRALRKCAKNIKTPDNLVIYFSGHGHYDSVTEAAYLVPVDARFSTIRDYYSYDLLMRILGKINSQHTLLIVDSCYSGAFLVREVRSGLERLERDPSRWILASGRNEVVSDGTSGENSPFADELLDVLDRYSGEGLNVMNLVDKVTTSVTHNARQTPIGCPLQDVGDKGGQFVFYPKRSEEKDWEEVKGQNSETAYQKFISLYPKGEYTEEAYWQIAILNDNKLAFRNYRQLYPKGKYARKALENIAFFDEKLQFELAKRRGEAALTLFLETFPDSSFVKAARVEIKRLVQEEQRLVSLNKTISKERVHISLRSLISIFTIVIFSLFGIVLSNNMGTPNYLKAFESKRDKLLEKTDSQEKEDLLVEKTLLERKILLEGKNFFEDHLISKMILVPGGEFLMGDVFEEGQKDEKPVRKVELDSFYLSQAELSIVEFSVFIEETDSKLEKWTQDYSGKTVPKDKFDYPVTSVSWYDAVNYCNWLSRKSNLTEVYIINDTEVKADMGANGYRLPTEAEWEYAAREKGKKVRFGNGRDKIKIKDLNFNGRKRYKKPYFDPPKKDTFRKEMVPIFSLPGSENSLGLYHMSGNVWEWCWDSYDKYVEYNRNNPSGPESKDGFRVVRGGSADSRPEALRVSERERFLPTYRASTIGFRLARTF